MPWVKLHTCSATISAGGLPFGGISATSFSAAARSTPMPVSYRIRLGKRFDPPKNVGAFAQELEQYFKAELAAALLAKRPTDAAALERQPAHDLSHGASS